MKKTKLTKLILPKYQIDKLNVKDKKRYLMFTCMISDMDILEKLLIFASNDKPKNEPYLSANATMVGFLLKSLISKIHEMKIFICKNKIQSNSESFSDDLKNKIAEIEIFFADKDTNTIFAFIRDKFGFHYEYKNDIDQLIDQVSKNYSSFEMWLSSEDSTNEIFPSSNDIIFDVIFIKMQELGFSGNKTSLFDQLVNLSIKAAKLFCDLSVEYISEAFPVQWILGEQIEIDAPEFSEVKLPLIVTW
jgi:hypothetical protein